MKNSYKTLVALTIGTFMAAPVASLFAEPVSKAPHPARAETRHRVIRQADRLKQDVKDGKLTQVQADQFAATDKSIQAEKAADLKANGNGKLTEAQTKQINSELDANSKAIYAATHPTTTTQGTAATPSVAK